jgi:1-acyl-sn-glycerol-3-phosphate acyltransferase
VTLLRSALFNLVFFAGTFVLALCGIPLRLAAPHRIIGLARFWAGWALAMLRIICGIRWEVSGREHLPEGAALIASQHQSAFDTLVWLLIAPRCCYVLKRELTRIPLFGPLILPTGMIAVDRDAGAAALRALMKDGRRAAAEGRQIVIFPEGTRAEPGHLLPLQPGVAALAAATGLPVIPVATNSGRFWSRRAFVKRPGTIRIAIQPPLPAGLGKAALLEQLEAALRAGSAAVDKRG